MSSFNLIINTSNCVSYAANTNDSLGDTLLKCTIPNVMVPVGSNATIAGGSLARTNSSLIRVLGIPFCRREGAQSFRAVGHNVADEFLIEIGPGKAAQFVERLHCGLHRDHPEV